MNKRGLSERQWFWLFYIVLVAVIIGALIYYVEDAADDTAFKHDFYLRDIPLTINIMSSMEGYVKVNYPIEKEFFVNLEDGYVKITHEKLTKKYQYIRDEEVDIKIKREGNVLILEKV